MTIGDIEQLIRAVGNHRWSVLTVPGVVYEGYIDGCTDSREALIVDVQGRRKGSRRMVIAIEHIVAVCIA